MSAVDRCLFLRASGKFLVGMAMCTHHVRLYYITRALYGMYTNENGSVKQSAVVKSSSRGEQSFGRSQ